MERRIEIRMVIRDDLVRRVFGVIPEEITTRLPKQPRRVDAVVSLKDFGSAYTLQEARDITERSELQLHCTIEHLIGQACQYRAVWAGRFFALDQTIVGPAGSKFFPYYETTPSGLVAGLRLGNERLTENDRVMIRRAKDVKK